MSFDTAEIDDPMNLKPALNGWRPLADRLGATQPAIAPKSLRANVESACSRKLPQIPRIPRHGRELLVCAGGPSLKRGLPDIRRRQKEGAHIAAVNKASEYLLANGIVPNGVVLADPQEVLTDQCAVDKRITYLIASQCSPRMFDMLEGCDLLLWHCQGDDEKKWILPFYPDPVLSSTGTTAALRMIELAYIMGFRTMHFYGLDGSFEADENGDVAHHAYAQTEDDMPECVVIRPVMPGEDPESAPEFLTRGDYARQADEFMGILKMYDGFYRKGLTHRVNVQVHGDGLIPYIWRKRRHELS